jgi:hypothetical protein
MDRKIFTIDDATKEFGWLGQIIKIHVIGPYDIVEMWQKPASNNKDKNTYKSFSICIDGKNKGRGYDTLDAALAGCIAIRHDGDNTKADEYFIRGIGGDFPPESFR